MDPDETQAFESWITTCIGEEVLDWYDQAQDLGPNEFKSKLKARLAHAFHYGWLSQQLDAGRKSKQTLDNSDEQAKK